MGEPFNHVSGFEVILAVSVRGEPLRGQIVDSVIDDKRIVVGLGDSWLTAVTSWKLDLKRPGVIHLE